MGTPDIPAPAPTAPPPPADRTRTGLRLFAGCALVQAVLAVVPRLLATLSLSMLRAEDGGFSDFPWSQYLYPVFQGLHWLCSAGMALGLWLYTTTFARNQAGLALSALFLYGLQALLDTFYFVVEIAQRAGVSLEPGTWTTVWPILFWTGLAVELAGLGCLLVAFAARQRDRAGPPLARLIIATAATAILIIGFNIVFGIGMFDLNLRFEHPWLHFVLATVFSLAYAVALFFLALAHARPAALPPGAAIEPPSPAVEFPAGLGRGLATYRAALLWRLGVTVAGMILMVLAQLGRSLPAMKYFLVASALLSLACGAFMLAGMERVRERVARIAWMMGFTIPLSVLAQLVLRFTRIHPVPGLALAGAVLVLAIITLVLFLGLLNRIILRLEDASSPLA